MANVDVKLGLQPSILDRLIDPESNGTAILIGYDTTKMAEAVRRDLEELLNARVVAPPEAEGLEEVPTSIIMFGLPDLISANALTGEARQQIGRVIEEIIERYEPRLREPRAILLDPETDYTTSALRYRVEATLNVNPAEPVAFNTVLEVGSGYYNVQKAGE